MKKETRLSLLSVIALAIFAAQLIGSPGRLQAEDVTYEKAQAILTKHCAGCHNADDANGEFALDDFASLLRGGESGNALTPGSSASSRMILMLKGKLEPAMPPEGEARPTDNEIQLLVDWIDGGAKGPTGKENTTTSLASPKIESKSTTSPVTALAFDSQGSQVAVGQFGSIKIRKLGQTNSQLASAATMTISDLPGKVTSIQFSKNDSSIFATTGVVGLVGKAVEIDVASGRIVREFVGHRDMAYSLDINETENLMVTAGYDRKAVIWNLRTGEKKVELLGHNGGIFSAKFDPTSQVVSTASADGTVKIWKVANGERLDTRSEPLKEQYATDFSPDGTSFVAGGADNRIRKWQLASKTDSNINPIEVSRFAHESSIQQLQYHPSGNWIVSVGQDGLTKVWDSTNLTELHSFPKQTVSVQALDVAENRLVIGKMNGSVEVLDWPDLAKKIASNTEAKKAKSVSVARPVQASSAPNKVVDAEPNDSVEEAVKAKLPFVMTGTIHGTDRTDVDLVKFSAKAGESWIMEVKAARNKSPLDSQISILDSLGKPVPRVLLQAVRDSYFTFRGKDSKQTSDFRVHNWEEMQIGQMLYCNGEVVRLYHAPRGPDSGFNVFPNVGNRQSIFDTTPLTHALNEPCFIVEAFSPDANVAQTGLPQYLINYENDDDAERELGTDSRLTFTAPADGDYFVQIRDTRDFQGEKFKYELTVRKPSPSFAIKRIDNAKPQVAKGGFRKFGIMIDRIDGYDGEVEVTVENSPTGYEAIGSTTIERGQLQAWMVLHANEDAKPPTDESSVPTIVATAEIGGKEVRQEKPLGKIRLDEKVQMRVELQGNVESDGKYPIVEVRAGTTTSTLLKVDRVLHKKLINFGQENAGVNFPFGVFVDNIGLNGVLLPPTESERTIYLTAEDFVEPCERLVFLEAGEAGKTGIQSSDSARAAGKVNLVPEKY